MFGIGTSELLLVLLVALIVLGPRRLPEIATKLGQAVGAFRRMSTQFQRTLNSEIATLEEKEYKPNVSIEDIDAEENVHSAPTKIEELVASSVITSSSSATEQESTAEKKSTI